MLSFESLETLGNMAYADANKSLPWFVVIVLLGIGTFGCERESPEKRERPPPAPKGEKSLLPEPKGPSIPKPVEGSLRLVVVGASEPLASERTQLLELEAALRKAKFQVDAKAATPEEKKAATELASEKSVQVASWSEFETVMILEMVAPFGSEEGKRLSRGRGNLFLLHPPHKEATYSTISETSDSGALLHGGKLGAWVATHLRFRSGEPGQEPPPDKEGPVLVKKGAE